MRERPTELLLLPFVLGAGPTGTGVRLSGACVVMFEGASVQRSLVVR